jgi:hypothetical protein
MRDQLDRPELADLLRQVGRDVARITLDAGVPGEAQTF